MAVRRSGRLICLGALALAVLPAPAMAQAPYVPDVTEAREREWRSLTAAAQKAYVAGDSVEGEGQARKALAVAEELFGADDPRTLISANDLALHLDALHRDREAETYLRRVFDSYFRTRGEDDPNTQLALENLVDFYLARKQAEAARPLTSYALSSFRRTTGAGSERSRRMERILASLPETPADGGDGGAGKAGAPADEPMPLEMESGAEKAPPAQEGTAPADPIQ